MKTIIIAIISLVFIQISLSAQTENGIIYYDYTPDTSVYKLRSGANYPFDSLFIDIDRNNTNDIKLYFNVTSPTYVTPSIISINDNMQCCVIKSDTISSDTNVWTYGIIWLYSDAGDELDSLAIRYSDGEDYYYGWFRAYKDSNDTAIFLVVDKTAFCTIPNYPLLWGQTSTNGISIKDTSDSSLELNYNNNKGKVLVYYPKGIIDEVEIINSSGQLLNKISNINADNTEINVSNYKSGMYIVRANLVNKTVVSAKFVK
jgi:hypothetical protein